MKVFMPLIILVICIMWRIGYHNDSPFYTKQEVNQKKAALKLGVSRKTIYSRIKRKNSVLLADAMKMSKDEIKLLIAKGALIYDNIKKLTTSQVVVYFLD